MTGRDLVSTFSFFRPPSTLSRPAPPPHLQDLPQYPLRRVLVEVALVRLDEVLQRAPLQVLHRDPQRAARSIIVHSRRRDEYNSTRTSC